MSTVPLELDPHDVRPEPKLGTRRGFRFRLSTLFLAMTVCSICIALTDNQALNLAIILVLLGGLFGGSTGGKQVRALKPDARGVRLAIRLAATVANSGAVVGMTAAPVVLWVALLREHSDWLYLGTASRSRTVLGDLFIPTWPDHLAAISHLLVSGLYASSLGALLGTFGSLTLGLAWALAVLKLRTLRGQPTDLSNSDLRLSRDDSSRHARSWPWIKAGCGLVGVLGFPLYSLSHVLPQLWEIQQVNRARAPGVEIEYSNDSCAPLILRNDLIEGDIVGESIRRGLRRVSNIRVTGPADDQTLTSLTKLPRGRGVSLHCSPTDEQLPKLALAETLWTARPHFFRLST